MTDLALAPAHNRTPAAGATSAAALAARIEVPRRLPPRHDGQPIGHLSNSSYTLFLACPDAWRRRYLLGEKQPPSGAMFLGSRVDETLTYYYRHWLEHRERLGLRELKRFFGANWKQQLGAENDKLGVAWDERLDRHTALKLGVKALVIAFEELVPQLGEPVAVQRQVEFRLVPELEWTIEGAPGPRDPPPGPRRRGACRGDRRLQGQGRQRDHRDHRRAQPAGQPVPRRPLARGPARRALPIRADPDPRRPAQDPRHVVDTHRAQRRRAAVDARADRARGQPDRRSSRPFSGRSVRVRSVRVCEPVELLIGDRPSSRLLALAWLVGLVDKTRLSSRRPSPEGRGLSGDSRVRGFAGGVGRALTPAVRPGCGCAISDGSRGEVGGRVRAGE
jgi:hypothetical protein